MDVVTQKPGVEIGFSFADICHAEDIYRLDYDYRTCEGRYKPIDNQTTDKNGTVFVRTFPYIYHPPYFRYYIFRADGYLKTPTYGSLSHRIVWLVPDDAPLPSKKAAIEYLSNEEPIKEIINFYSSNGMETEYLFAEEEAFYGIWRVTINVFKPRIFDGQKPRIMEGQQSYHTGIEILVHPGNYDYIICNPWKDRVSDKIELLGLEEGEESFFFKNLPNTYLYEFGTKGCNPELLLE